ncbi:protein of unknown function [Methylorubrum extorquens]|uniref:Uncharacterized protein n=1 Tax=Methylorubrum extorquens TaxID=408 RepID=A0A2N9AGZ5_METEX|nr:protein of unknown function [Methylorubrum extorquens]
MLPSKEAAGRQGRSQPSRLLHRQVCEHCVRKVTRAAAMRRMKGFNDFVKKVRIPGRIVADGDCIGRAGL